jgi:hypothetical protein
MENIGSAEPTVAPQSCPVAAGPRYPDTVPRAGVRTRRLSDKIIVAFHVACDVQDYETGWRLLELAEKVMKGAAYPDGQERRREIVGLAAAHFRLWGLVHANRQ